MAQPDTMLAIATDYHRGVKRRVEAELWKVGEAIQGWMFENLAGPLAPDWRESFRAVLAEQAAQGRIVAPESVAAFEAAIEQFAVQCARTGRYPPAPQPNVGMHARPNRFAAADSHSTVPIERSLDKKRAAPEPILPSNLRFELHESTSRDHTLAHPSVSDSISPVVDSPSTTQIDQSDKQSSKEPTVIIPLPPDYPTRQRIAEARDRSERHLQPAAALRYVFVPSDEPIVVPSALRSGRGDQTRFAREAEEIVSEFIGIPLNRGPNRQTIPGSGPGGIRFLDLPVRGPKGTVRLRGSIVDIKASKGTTFGHLSGRARQQLKDAVQYAARLRRKASLVHDPAFKQLLENAHVEVFSDLPPPTRGKFKDFIRQGLLKWKPIPRSKPVSRPVTRGARSMIPTTPRSIGKPGVGAGANIAFGVLASLAEAGVAEAVYRDASSVLEDLLKQLTQNDDADEKDWKEIEAKLKEIASMRQSIWGYIVEFMTYGQRSLKEKQAMAMMFVAHDLAKKFGYENKRTWDDSLNGRFGHFEKRR